MSAGEMAAELTAEEEAREDIRHFAAVVEHFETHDISEELAASPEVPFETGPRLRRKRYPLEDELSEKPANIVSRRGVSAEALLNEWVREKAAESRTVGAAE